jgi:hypothetical protein
MPTPAKIDLLKEHRAEYVAPRKPVLLVIRSAVYLAIRGQGRPGDETFVAQIGALYAVAFTTKMQRKFAGRGDYTIGKLEARWFSFPAAAGSTTEWELLIRTPGCVTADDLAQARATLHAKGHGAAIDDVQRIVLDEGRCVQLLHVGPYEDEPRAVEVMTVFATGQRLQPHGAHHEIYLSDPRRVPPERLRTILRMPVSAVSR